MSVPQDDDPDSPRFPETWLGLFETKGVRPIGYSSRLVRSEADEREQGNTDADVRPESFVGRNTGVFLLWSISRLISTDLAVSLARQQKRLQLAGATCAGAAIMGLRHLNVSTGAFPCGPRYGSPPLNDSILLLDLER